MVSRLAQQLTNILFITKSLKPDSFLIVLYSSIYRENITEYQSICLTAWFAILGGVYLGYYYVYI